MFALHERSVLGHIEYLEIIGEIELARKMMTEYEVEKLKFIKRGEDVLISDQVFEGKLLPLKLGDLNDEHLFLYQKNGEVILLELGLSLKDFQPLFNQNIKIRGKVIQKGEGEKKVLVKKILSLEKERIFECYVN